MNRSRRQVLGAAAAAAFATPLRAQRQVPDAGIDYKVLDRPQPVEKPGRIEVMEFFWYGCPHCYAFEPPLAAWIARQPGDVAFRRLPAQFSPVWQQHAKLYYALEATGQLERVHRKTFDAIHIERMQLVQDAEMIEWAAKNGIDRERFTQALGSADVAARQSVARAVLGTYGVDGVPAMAVNGRFLTAPSIVGSHERCLQVVDYLVEQERRARKA